MPSVTSRSLFVRGAAAVVTVSRGGRGRARFGAGARPGSACRFSQKISTIRSFSAATVLAECGLTSTFGRSQNGLESGGGSVVKTSSAAPRRRPDSSASASAASSTTSPAGDVDDDGALGQKADPAGVEEAVRSRRCGASPGRPRRAGAGWRRGRRSPAISSAWTSAAVRPATVRTTPITCASSARSRRDASRPMRPAPTTATTLPATSSPAWRRQRWARWSAW